MAMFGNFTELPFLEVIRLVRSRRGRLTVYPENGRVYKLFVQDGSLVSVLLGDVQVGHTVVQDLLLLTHSRTGRFEFMQLPNVLPNTQMNLSLEGLDSWLLSQDSHSSESERTARDLEQFRDSLPHPSTVFAMLEQRSGEAQSSLQGFLERWSMVHPQLAEMLRQGISAEQLQNASFLPLEQAQLALYRLQQVSAIGVMRARDRQDAPVSTSPVRKPGLLSRLLGALGLVGSGR
jgi:hypothetical protein